MNQDVCAAKTSIRMSELVEHANCVVRPVVFGLELVFNVNRDIPLKALGPYIYFGIRTHRDCRPSVKVNRCRHDKSFVVIGVLTDQVHASRCPEYLGFLAVEVAKIALESLDVHQLKTVGYSRAQRTRVDASASIAMRWRRCRRDWGTWASIRAPCGFFPNWQRAPPDRPDGAEPL